MKLSILIPTTVDREDQFNRLTKYLFKQIEENSLQNEIEVQYICDTKEMSVGAKRQLLYEMAKGEYSWMIDDDDWIAYDAIAGVYNELDGICDCVGFKELCIFDGKRVESSNFSLVYPGWMDNYDGFNHVRTPFFKTPIKTKLCLEAGVKDQRWGEDNDFAIRIYPYLETENYIDEFVYIYQHNSSPHNDRYGIK